MPNTPQDPFSAGAARAAGERRRRRTTPLVGAEPVVVAPDPLAADSAATARPARSPRPRPRAHRPVPQVQPPAPVTSRPVDERPPVRRLRAVPDPDSDVTGVSTPSTPAAASATGPSAATAVSARDAVPAAAAKSRQGGIPRSAGDPAQDGETGATSRPRAMRAPGDAEVTDSLLAAALTQQELTPDLEDVISAIVGILRTLAAASGLGADEVEGQVARTLAFLRRRLTGEYAVDEFGFDQDYTDNFYLPLLRPIYKQWFRVEVRGIDNIPTDGSALIVANHSGTIALDAHMVQVAIHDEHPHRRHLRLLGADLVFQSPVIGPLARKQGATLAANSDAERLLRNNQIVGVFPEGFKGVGKPFSERYKLQRFGRGGFVSAAIRTGAPIVPCSIVGAEETYPLIGDVKLLARLFGAPYFPVTPTWPWLGLLGLIPLPSKWIIEFGEPVQTAHLGPAAADDPMVVFDLTDQVRETIQQTLYSLLMLRRSVFS
ncbi:MAG: lysophospholipid acyltransferase family protein [Dermatophilaceae bacterium]